MRPVRPRALTACAAVFIASQTFVVSLPASSSTPCDRLRAWARAYEGTSPTLEAIAAFDRPHRIAIFNAIGPAARATVAREQLQRFSQRSTLSTAQRALIAEGREILTSALYAGDRRAAQSFEQFWSRAAPAFRSREDRLPWFVLGSVLERQPHAPSTRRASDLELCECSNVHPWPPCTGGCPFGGCEQWWGCGPGWAFTCNGFCA